MRPRRVAIFILLATIVITGCRKKPATPPDVVVRVGDRMVTLADFKRYLDRNTGTDLAQMTPEVASALLDQFIEEIILAEYAAAHGVEVPAEKIAEAVRTEAGSTVIEKRDEMRRQKLMLDITADIADLTDAEVRKYYEEHQGDFRSGEEVRARQILVHEEALANEIAAKLKQGESFEDLSTRYSHAPNADRGGDIGFVSRGELPKMFEDEIFRMKPGEVSEVIRTDSSFHIFKVVERRSAGIVDFESAAPVIRARLREDAIRERMAQLVARSRNEISVSVLLRRLPFKYSGAYPKVENE